MAVFISRTGAKALPLPNMLSIDPGLSGTGWAAWRGTKLLRAGVVYPPANPLESLTGSDTPDKAAAITQKLLADMRFPSHVDPFQMTIYIEMPQHMTSAKGIAAQAGAVYKLAFFVGYLARAFHPTDVRLVIPMEWKGQLPKDVVQRRIIRTLGVNTCTKLNIRSHAWDAVGLGLWANGKRHK